jgi:glycosyltransferase involved in cell wall biosynthesis
MAAAANALRVDRTPSQELAPATEQALKGALPEQPLVSIVIPAYNHGAFLHEAIRSVLEQDYPRVELIVIDDGSTDNTADVLRLFGNAFHWESQRNMGQAVALNKGWLRSRGQILSYLGADDRLLPGAVSASVKALQRAPDAVLAYCDFDIVTESMARVRTVRTREFDYFDVAVNTVCIPGPGAFFLREAHERTGGWNPRLRQMPDFDYWLRLGLHGRFVRIPQVLAAYRSHSASQTCATPTEERAEEPLRILDDYFSSVGALPQRIANARARALGSAHLVTAQLHFLAGRYKAGAKHVQHAHRLYWKHALLPRTYRLCAHGLLSRRVKNALARLRQPSLKDDQQSVARAR